MALSPDYETASNERLLNLMKLDDSILLAKYITPDMADKITLQEVIYFFCTYTKNSDEKEKIKALDIYATEFNLKKFFLKVIIKHIYSLQNIIQISEIFKQNTDEIEDDLTQSQIEKILEKKNNDDEPPIDSHLLYNLITNNIFWEDINNTTFNTITLEELTIFLCRYKHNIDFTAFGFDTAEKNPKKLLFDVINKYKPYIKTIKSASDILRKNANSIGSIMGFNALFEDDIIKDDMADEVINRLLIKDDTDTLGSRTSTGTLRSRTSTDDWFSTFRSQIEYDQNFTPKTSPRPPDGSPRDPLDITSVLDAIPSGPAGPPDPAIDDLKQQLINRINEVEALFAMEALALEHEKFAHEYYVNGLENVPQELTSKKMLLTLIYKFKIFRYNIKEAIVLAEIEAEEITIELMRLTGNVKQQETSNKQIIIKKTEQLEVNSKRRKLEATEFKKAQDESTKEIKEKEEELRKTAEEAKAAEIAAETEAAKTPSNQLLILHLKEHALRLKIKELMLKRIVEFTKSLENNSDEICYEIIKDNVKQAEAYKKKMENIAAGKAAYEEMTEKEKERFEIEKQILQLTNPEKKTFEQLEEKITNLMKTNQEIKKLQEEKNKFKKKAEEKSLKIDEAERDTLAAETDAENEIKMAFAPTYALSHSIDTLNKSKKVALNKKKTALHLKEAELQLKIEIHYNMIEEIILNYKLLSKIQDEKLISDDFKEILDASIQANNIKKLSVTFNLQSLQEEIKIIGEHIKVIEEQIIAIEKIELRRPPPSLPIGGLVPPPSTTPETLEDITNLEDLLEFANKKKIKFDQVISEITRHKTEIHNNFTLLIESAFEYKVEYKDNEFDRYKTDINNAFSEVNNKKKNLDEIKQELTNILEKLKRGEGTITLSKTDTRVAPAVTFRLEENRLKVMLGNIESDYNEHIKIIKELGYMNEYTNILKNTPKYIEILNLIYINFKSLLSTELINNKSMVEQNKKLKDNLEKEEFKELLLTLPPVSDLSSLSNEEEKTYIKENKLLLYWKLNNLNNIIRGYCFILDDYNQLKEYEKDEHYDYKEYRTTRQSLTLKIINYIKLLFKNAEDENNLLFFIKFKRLHPAGFTYLQEFVNRLNFKKNNDIKDDDIMTLENEFKENLSKDPSIWDNDVHPNNALFQFLYKIKKTSTPINPDWGSPINKLITMIHHIYTSLENIGKRYGWLGYVRKGGDSSKTLKIKQLKRKKTHKNY